MVRNVYLRDGKKEKLIRTEIVINDKIVNLRFTQPMWFKLEENICQLEDLYTMMHSKGRFEIDKFPAVVELMTDGTITAKEVVKDADPATMKALLEKVSEVIATSVTMREKRYDDDSVHDEVLEEIEKKDPKAD